MSRPPPAREPLSSASPKSWSASPRTWPAADRLEQVGVALVDVPAGAHSLVEDGALSAREVEQVTDEVHERALARGQLHPGTRERDCWRHDPRQLQPAAALVGVEVAGSGSPARATVPQPPWNTCSLLAAAEPVRAKSTTTVSTCGTTGLAADAGHVDEEVEHGRARHQAPAEAGSHRHRGSRAPAPTSPRRTPPRGRHRRRTRPPAASIVAAATTSRDPPAAPADPAGPSTCAAAVHHTRDATGHARLAVMPAAGQVARAQHLVNDSAVVRPGAALGAGANARHTRHWSPSTTTSPRKTPLS